MSGADDLDLFVKDSLSRKLSRDAIQSVLTQAGWRPEQIGAAFRRYADVEFAIPVPRPKVYLSPREAFMYLVMFTTLYISAYQVGSLLFDVINSVFPDPVRGTDFAEYARVNMRWAISMLVVAFPVFLLMASLIGRDVKRDAAKRASQVRKWLTYLTLFIAASVLIGDVTTLVFNVLGGELTVRFVLKVLVVASIAGATFAYYLWDLRQDEREPE